jgi:hypothetical protein
VECTGRKVLRRSMNYSMVLFVWRFIVDRTAESPLMLKLSACSLVSSSRTSVSRFWRTHIKRCHSSRMKSHQVRRSLALHDISVRVSARNRSCAFERAAIFQKAWFSLYPSAIVHCRSYQWCGYFISVVFFGSIFHRRNRVERIDHCTVP